ncbi:MAG: hypothetical protein R3B45_09225 [Bdellovibrionota bacterium]
MRLFIKTSLFDKNKKKWHLLSLLAAVVFPVSCGTRAGNPDDDSGIEVKIVSEDYSSLNEGALLLLRGEEFKFCVEKLKLKGKGRDGALPVHFEPGLIDVSSGEAVEWGTAVTSMGTYDELKVTLAANSEVCGVDYSLIYGPLTFYDRVTLKWSFEPEIDVYDSNVAMSLALEEIVELLKAGIENDDDSDTLKIKIENAQNKGVGKDKSKVATGKVNKNEGANKPGN